MKNLTQNYQQLILVFKMKGQKKNYKIEKKICTTDKIHINLS